MARELTVKQRKWADLKLKTGNGTKSALKVYNTKDYATANAIAVENLQKPSVRQYLEDKASRASEIVFELAENAENEGVRLGASKDILDRAGYKPVEKTLNVSVELEPSEELKALADKLNAH